MNEDKLDILIEAMLINASMVGAATVLQDLRTRGKFAKPYGEVMDGVFNMQKEITALAQRYAALQAASVI